MQLLRLGALSAAARQDSGEIQTAQEKVAEALALLGRIGGVKTTAGQIKKSATKIDGESDSLATNLGPAALAGTVVLAGATVIGAADEGA